MHWEEQVLRVLAHPGYSPQDAAGLGRSLNIRAHQRSDFDRLLEELERTGKIARIRNRLYALPQDADLIPGRILINRSGGGILEPEDPRMGRLKVPPEATGTALHHDRVLVRKQNEVGPADKIGLPEPQGKVIRILQRARTHVVGTLQRSRQFLYIIPDDPRIPHDIYVPPPRKGQRSARVGDKVVVALAEWPSRHNNPEGRIVEVLGKPGQPAIDSESILRQYQLAVRFPPAVRRQCEAGPATVRPSDLKGRIDFRAQIALTIDPDDAKDFDDAFFLEPAGKGRCRLWVHIADVAHYVVDGSLLDREAARRGNSTYLVDQVVPMLPEPLSNELCSLKPGVDRLVKSVEFLLTDDGKILQTRFHSSVIRSRRRFTYHEALAVLDRKPRDPIETMLHRAHRIAQRLRRARFAAGALDLDFPEFTLRLDAAGRLERVERREYDVSHQLIEEFMLLTNEAVAHHLRTARRGGLFRIHEEPGVERLEEFRHHLQRAGVRCSNLRKPGEVQRVLKRLAGHPAEAALKIAFLRSLKRARYSPDPLGHFGLAKKDYTHFTSPIRRYADLVVHRALFGNTKLPRLVLERLADQTSFTERNSADAEQDSRTVTLLNHLNRQLNVPRRETYSAVVTDIRNFGFFVELSALGFSGVVRVSTLEDDFYVFEPARSRLVGRRHRRTISLGDQVRVHVAEVDFFKRQANFVLVKAGKTKSSRRVARQR